MSELHSIPKYTQTLHSVRFTYLHRGTYPPLLLLETLLTIHDILFPIANSGDRKSRSELRKLIKKQEFDPEATWVEFVRLPPSNVPFEYWGDRLSKLYEFVRTPPPAGALKAWFERHTSERNALTTAIIGIFLAGLFGLLGVIVGVLQLCLAWLAWKHPAAA